MEISRETVYKFLTLGGLMAGLFLLVNFQFVFAFILFIIAGISFFWWKK